MEMLFNGNLPLPGHNLKAIGFMSSDFGFHYLCQNRFFTISFILIWIFIFLSFL